MTDVHIMTARATNTVAADPEIRPYDLSHTGSSRFYKSLSSFTDSFLREAQFRLGDFTARYIDHVGRTGSERARSFNEYLIEPLILGILFREYSSHSAATGALPVSALKLLGKIRRFGPSLKKGSDFCKGLLLPLLIHANPHSQGVPSLKRIRRLMHWLDASGEFREEILRLRGWIGFLETRSTEERERLLAESLICAEAFERKAVSKLGSFTTGVAGFTRNIRSRYHCREDLIFCGRSESEYHLNMFGAEVMNREFRESFRRKQRKIVLLPTCMRNTDSQKCRAERIGTTLSCAQCSPGCTINQITSQVSMLGAETRLIPHSSDFSRFLRQWENSPDTGLVGVACVLNLLAGGFEMRRLNIASQCVFLNFSGCRKHWSLKGIPTDLDCDQLIKILES